MPTKKPESRPSTRSKRTEPPAGVSEPPAAEILPAPVPDDVIEATVQEVNEISRQATLEISLKLGNLIVERFYGGDLGAWRDRGTTDASFRKLAAHPDLMLSPSGVYRAVAVFEVCERLDGVSRLKHLGVGHFRAILGIADKQQEHLLTTASEKGWSVDKLEEEAGKIRKREGDTRGRKPDPGFVKGIRRMEKLLDGGGNWFGDLDKVDQLDEEEAEALWKTVTGMKLKCEALQKALQVKVPGFESRES